MYDFEYVSENIRIEQELFEMNCITERSIILNESVISTIIDGIARFFVWLKDKFIDFIDWIKGLFGRGGSSGISNMEKKVEKIVIDNPEPITINYKTYHVVLQKLNNYLNKVITLDYNGKNIKQMVDDLVTKLTNKNELDKIAANMDIIDLPTTDEELHRIESDMDFKALRSLIEEVPLSSNHKDRYRYSDTIGEYLQFLQKSYEYHFFEEMPRGKIFPYIKEFNKSIPNINKTLDKVKKYVDELLSYRIKLENAIKYYEKNYFNFTEDSDPAYNYIRWSCNEVMYVVKWSYQFIERLCAEFAKLISFQKNGYESIMVKLLEK